MFRCLRSVALSSLVRNSFQLVPTFLFGLTLTPSIVSEMPLCGHIAMTLQMAEAIEGTRMTNATRLNLPCWCEYVPFKWSEEEAVQAFLPLRNSGEEDYVSDGSEFLAILSFTFSDEAVVQFINRGELETDAKHQGFKVWGEIPLNGDIFLEWKIAKLG